MRTIYKYFVLFLLIYSCASNEKINILLIGDSTMSDKPNPEINPERGWGQMLPLFFNENVTIKNFAVNGRSTKSFINEGRWDTVLEEINNGDYILIQFGHNDQKFKDSLRYTNPLTAYSRNLIRFVKESRNKGGIPILISPVVRRKFNEHGVLKDTHGIYPLIVRQIALEFQVPFIDLQLKSEDLLISLGDEKSKELFMWISPGEYSMYPEGKKDDTHFTVKGATEIARLVVEGFLENNLNISKFLKYNH